MWWNRRQLFVIQHPLLCVCLSISVVSPIWCCLSFTSTQNKLHNGYKCNKTSTWARADRITGCVFLHANKLSLLGIHTEQSKQSQFSREPIVTTYARSRRLSLRKEPSPAFLAVPIPLSPRQSGGCARGNRSWIRWRERRWASSYLLPFPSDSTPALWVRKPALRFLPPRERTRRSACLPPRRWTWLALSPPFFPRSSALSRGSEARAKAVLPSPFLSKCPLL